MTSSAIDALMHRIRTKQAHVGVVGMGYVGLPLALLFAEKGFQVTGFDIDPAKVDALNDGRSYIRHIPAGRIAAVFKDGASVATTDFSKAGEADAIIICVPTPLGASREPDLSYVVSTAEMLAMSLRAGQLVVLESTTYPGTTRDVLKPILETSGLASGRDMFLAYSPEREDPGNPDFGTAVIPKVVGGDGQAAQDLAIGLYDQVVVKTVPVSSPDVAEAVKLTENIFRSVNIALVNELKTVYAAMGIDIWEVIEAAKTKPFGYMPFYPGPGLGGHCIPIDPFYLTWRAKQFDQETRFIELAGEINTAMPEKVVGTVGKALRDRKGKDLNGSKVLLVGVAYKKNVDDIRESPGLVLIELLESRGAQVDYFDPWIPEIPVTREHARLAGRQSVSLAPDILGAYDAALICTDHDDIDYGSLAAHVGLVIDTRNATRAVAKDREKILKA